MDHPDPILQFEEARSRGELLRAEALRLQINAGLTICDALQIEIDAHPGKNVRPALEKLRHSADKFQFHIDEPHHIPSESKPELRQLLSRLESRLSQLEESSNPSPPHPTPGEKCPHP